MRFTGTWVSLLYIFTSYANNKRDLLTLGSVYYIFLPLPRALNAFY